jgi:hypothetical protein
MGIRQHWDSEASAKAWLAMTGGVDALSAGKLFDALKADGKVHVSATDGVWWAELDDVRDPKRDAQARGFVAKADAP